MNTNNEGYDPISLWFAVFVSIIILLIVVKENGFTAADLLELARGMREVWR